MFVNCQITSISDKGWVFIRTIITGVITVDFFYVAFEGVKQLTSIPWNLWLRFTQYLPSQSSMSVLFINDHRTWRSVMASEDNSVSVADLVCWLFQVIDHRIYNQTSGGIVSLISEVLKWFEASCVWYNRIKQIFSLTGWTLELLPCQICICK